MKSIISKLFFISAFAITLGSCAKDEVQQTFSGGTAPVLAASASGTIPLNFATEDQLGVKFSWPNPNYQFANGVSSQDVSYTLEIDKTGSNFAGATKVSVSVSKDLSISYTQKQFNIVLSGLKLTVGVASSIDVRLISSINNVEATKLISNTLKFTVTTYNPPPKVEPPLTGNLWIVGNATNSGWNNPLLAPYDVSQKFTKVSATLYEITIPMLTGGGYKLIQEQGVWGSQYHALDNAAVLFGSFEKKDSDPQFPSPAVAGNYKVSIDFQAGTYTLTKQ
jgi:starch-binding outer membrane protein SusE/F